MDFEDSDTVDEAYLRSITIHEFTELVEEVVGNEKIKDCTSLCFQVFHSVMAESIKNRSYSGDYSELDTFSKHVRALTVLHKFDRAVFIQHFLKEFGIIPLEIAWWLHKSDIMSFAHYCDQHELEELRNMLLEGVKFNLENQMFNTPEIMQDLLKELFIGCYNLPILEDTYQREGTSAAFCLKVLHSLVDETVKVIFRETSEPFANFLPFIQHLDKYVHKGLMPRFHKEFLKKLMLHNVHEFNLNSSYVYQELWCSKKINKNLYVLYGEVFSKFCTLETVLSIMQENEDKINWKYCLAAVGMCVQTNPTGVANLKAAAMEFLKRAFQGGNAKEMSKAILFMRQGCMEEAMKLDYLSWYSSMFGSNTTFRTKISPPWFRFLISCLIKSIPFEPKKYLKIHIATGIAPAPKCNYLVHNYKDLCRARLEELRRSPILVVNGVDMTVLHILEDNATKEHVNPILAYIANTQRDDFYHIVVPQIRRNKLPFITVKELLLKDGYLSNEMLYFSTTDPDEKVFSSTFENDMFVTQKK